MTDAERLQGYETAQLLDELTDRLERVRGERIERDLVLQERHLQAVEATMLQFMHHVLSRDVPGTPAYPEWVVTVTDDELRVVERVVSAGKLPTGLSALTRRHNAIYQEARALLLKAGGSGNDSASTPQPPASPDTSGRPNPSKASSSPSKPSSSKRSSTPARSLKQP